MMPRTPTPARPRRRAGTRALAALLACTMALPPGVHAAAPVATPAPAQALQLPALGEAASEDLSVSAERRIGLEIMRQGRRDPAFIDDPVLQAYVRSLWDPLVAAARTRGDITAEIDAAFAWEVFLVLDRSVNAFALPGGYVGVHLGLIAMTATTEQLASVLAHELAHVTQRHIARSVAVQRNTTLLSVASLLLAILAAGRSANADAVNATIAGGQAAAVQGQLNFSRDMEREADRMGYAVLQGAGFDTRGMAEMFQRMDMATRLTDSGAFPYLRTHPLTADRITEARSRTLLQNAVPPRPPLLHALMQARARVLMDPSTQALQRLSGETSSPELTDRVHALYAGALAAAQLARTERAEALAQQAQALLREAPRPEPGAEAVLGLLQAQLQLARGDAVATLRTLGTLQAPAAGTGALVERPSMLLAAQAALALQRQGRPADEALRRSTDALQVWVLDHPQDASAWLALAAVSEAGGHRLRAVRASAEAQAALGDLGGAIDRLRAGQEQARRGGTPDFIEASVIDARLRQFMAERRQLMLDARGARASRDERIDPDADPRDDPRDGRR
jgi:predicted Zn-dependent protease